MKKTNDFDDVLLGAFLRANDPVAPATLDPLRVARVENAIMQRLALAPQERRTALSLVWQRGFGSWAAGRAVLSATLCIALGLWVGMDINAVRAMRTEAVSITQADTGVSVSNLPLLAMAAPWNDWVLSGEEK